MTLDVPRIQARVAELLAEYGIPSAAIGVLHDGELTELAVGVKNVETREPATTDTVYQCGSMTKTWTALAFMQLVDEGKVDLDEPVRTYLPGFAVADSEASAKVTPRHLLYHTNGIEEAYGDAGEGEGVYARMVENIADAPQVFPPGRTHGYSAALGYAILARILEVHDGAHWDAVMRHRLFEPMGLTSTNSWHEQVDEARTATGHLIRSLEEGPIVTPIALSATRIRPRRKHHLDLPGGARHGARPPQQRNGAKREAHRLSREYSGDAVLAGARTGSVYVRAGMGTRPHRM